MPTYEYACKECGERLEVHQSFTDASLTECPSCRGPLRKVFGNIAIAFKGSGFYKTDSRSSAGNGKTKADTGAAATPSSSEGSSNGGSSNGGSSNGGSGGGSSTGGSSKGSGSSTPTPAAAS